MAELKTNYGYRISTFSLRGTTDNRGTLGPEHMLDSSALHREGAFGLFLDGLTALKAEGPLRSDDKHHEVLSVHAGSDHYFILCVIKSGTSGRDYEIADESGKSKGKVLRKDTLTWLSRVLYIFPTGSSTTGFQVHETRGTSGHGTSTNERLIAWMREKHGLRPVFSHDVADSETWQRVLDNERAEIEELEFRAPPGDNAGFSEELNVNSFKVTIGLSPSATSSSWLLRPFRNIKENSRPVADLLDAVGGAKYKSELQDGTATARVAVDGKPHSIQLNARSSWFTWVIDDSNQLSNDSFLRVVGPAIMDLRAPFQVTLPDPFLPTEGIPSEIGPED